MSARASVHDCFDLILIRYFANINFRAILRILKPDLLSGDDLSDGAFRVGSFVSCLVVPRLPHYSKFIGINILLV